LLVKKQVTTIFPPKKYQLVAALSQCSCC